MTPTKKLKQHLYIVLITLLQLPLFSNLSGQSNALFTFPSPVSNSNLSASQLSRKNKFDSSFDVASSYLMSVQDIALVQESGRVAIALPGLQDTFRFRAAKFQYQDNGDYTWIGDIISPRTCLEDSTGYIEDDCISGFLLLMRQNGEYFGQFVIENDAYQIKNLGDGLSYLIKVNASTSPDNTCASASSNDTGSPIDPGPSGAAPSQDFCPARVLVLFTEGAEAEHPDILNIIDMSVAMTNQIFRQSKASDSDVSIVLVGKQKLLASEFTESEDIEDDRNSLPTNSAIAGYRNNANADLVIIMTKTIYSLNPNPEFAALGAVSGFGDTEADKETAFALVETATALAPGYVFTHEVGHLYGCRHGRKPEDCGSIGDNTGLPHSHGKVIVKNFWLLRIFLVETVMSVCIGNRIPYFSNPDVIYKAKKTGTEAHNNNARTIREAACRIANYLPLPSQPFVDLKAPQHPCAGEQGLIVASVEQVTAPLQFFWQTSINGINFYPSVPQPTSSNTLPVSFPGNPDLPLWVRVTVVGSNNETASNEILIYSDDCGGNNMKLNPGNKKFKDFAVYPNPAKGEINIAYSNTVGGDYSIDVFDVLGKLVYKTSNTDRTSPSEISRISVDAWRAGAYFVVLKDRTGTHTARINIVH
ncbi:MAG: zinc-dependent metalloprotease [Chitinophagales bacterium]|nr:zinc-dependent metalloprotease [Chitinophagales bacterium]